jgi:lysophospholipase L1-like esterase
MTKHRFLLIFLLVLAPAAGLWADGNGVPATAVNIVFIGDSITQGVGVPDAGTQAAPVIAAQELQKQLGDAYTVYFSNQGHAGHTTVDFLPGGGDFTQAEGAARDLQARHRGQLVFSVMLGTNDSANSGPNGSPVSAVTYAQNLEKMIDKLLTEFPNSKFFLNHPTWYSPNTHNGSDYHGPAAADRLRSYFPALDSVVEHYDLSNPNQVYTGDTQAYGYFENHRAELNGEGGQEGVFYLHPNARGAESLGRFWAGALATKIVQ